MYKSEDLQILEINNDMLIAVSGTKAPVLTHLKTSRSRMKGQTLGKLAETELSVLEYHKSDGYMIIVFLCVPGMAQFLRVKVPSRVFTAKCSEPQAENSNV